MVYCSFCLGQGLIYKVTIKRTNITLYICEECDTAWKDINIKENNAYNFKSIMTALGREALWSEFLSIERL